MAWLVATLRMGTRPRWLIAKAKLMFCNQKARENPRFLVSSVQTVLKCAYEVYS